MKLTYKTIFIIVVIGTILDCSTAAVMVGVMGPKIEGNKTFQALYPSLGYGAFLISAIPEIFMMFAFGAGLLFVTKMAFEASDIPKDASSLLAKVTDFLITLVVLSPIWGGALMNILEIIFRWPPA